MSEKSHKDIEGQPISFYQKNKIDGVTAGKSAKRQFYPFASNRLQGGDCRISTPVRTKMHGLELGRTYDIPAPSVVIVSATTTDAPTISTPITAKVANFVAVFLWNGQFLNILNFLSVELDF